MKKNLKSKIFVIVSVIFLLSLIILYSYRLIHFYRLEHPKVTEEPMMAEKIISQHEDMIDTDVLSVDDDTYYFRGKVETNYVQYSGLLWRILSIDSSHHIKLVLDDSITSMALRYTSMEQSDSYVQQWLTDTFINYLSNSDQYLLTNDFCVDVVLDVSKITCDSKESSFVGLLSLSDYAKASGKNGFLHQNQYFWLSNASSDGQNWFVLDDGSLDNGATSSSINSYGVRPVIVVNGDLPLISGSGTLDDPYMFENTSSTVLADKHVGEYISYSNMTWRIVGKTEDAMKLALDGYVLENGVEVTSGFSYTNSQYNMNDWYQLAYYLNSTFYGSLTNPEYLLFYNWNVGAYGDINSYDYHSINQEVSSAYVGLLGVGDLFLNDYSNYYLLTPTFDDSTVYTVLDGGRLYANMMDQELKIRPAIYLKKSISLAGGSGTQTDPYLLGGEINE